MFIIYLLLSYNKYKKFNKILPKAATLLLAAIISRWANTSIAESLDTDSQPIIRG